MNSYDEKCLDMMMEKYKKEIIAMQSARPPVRYFKEDKKDDFLRKRREERNNERLIFNNKFSLKGKLELNKNAGEFKEKYDGCDVACAFSVLRHDLPDLQRGSRLLEIKAEDESLFFSSLPCLLFKDKEDFKKLLTLSLWEYFLENKAALLPLLYYFSDRGTPASYAVSMASPVYELDDKYIRLYLEPKEKTIPFTAFEAGEASLRDRDYLLHDLKRRLAGEKNIEFDIILKTASSDDLGNLNYDALSPMSIWEEDFLNSVSIGSLILYEFKNEKEEFRHDKLMGKLKAPDEFFSIYQMADEDIENTCFAPFPKREGEEFFQFRKKIKALDERERMRILENMASSMESLDGDTLEKVLMAVTDADLSFGRALMNMIEA